MPAAFFGFTCVFPDNSRPRLIRALPVVGTVSLFFVALSLFTPLIAHTFVITPSGLRRQAGPLMPLFMLYFLVSTVLILALLISKWRRATGQARAQLRFYNTGLLSLCIGAITTNLVLPTLTGHSEYSTVGPFFVLPLVGLIGHAIIRYRLFDLRLMIHRSVAFLIFIGVCTTTIVLILKQLGMDEKLRAIEIPLETLVVAIVTAVSLSLPVAPYLARILDDYFLQSRPDLDRALQESARRLSRLLTVDDISRETEAILRTTLALETVMVLTDRSEPRHLSERVNDAAWAIALAPPTVLLLAREQDSITTHAPVATLRSAGMEVWVALGRGAHKTGVILLGPRKGGEAYLGSTLQFVEDIAEISSMAFEVAILHRRHLELERDRHRLEHLARMGRMYAGLGHEIRTPLTTISNLISLLPDRLEDPEFRDTLVRLIPAEIARIVKLSERLRLMAPADSAQFGVANIHRVLSDIATIHTASRDRFRVQVDVAGNIPDIRGDEAQLTQLFTNLVTNAIEAMPDGGQLVLRLRTTQNAQRDRVVRVDVIDQGEGIPKDIADRIFEPFFTTKPTGTGLGLSICREIADLHNATLTVARVTGGRGTAVTVEFPLGREEIRQVIVTSTTERVRQVPIP